MTDCDPTLRQPPPLAAVFRPLSAGASLRLRVSISSDSSDARSNGEARNSRHRRNIRTSGHKNTGRSRSSARSRTRTPDSHSHRIVTQPFDRSGGIFDGTQILDADLA
jgi:hypothetical protein